jgi:hypothetical protein
LLIGYYLRWDVNAINDLPDYMELCFLTDLYNTINEIAYENLKEKGANILPYLTKAVQSRTVPFGYFELSDNDQLKKLLYAIFFC